MAEVLGRRSQPDLACRVEQAAHAQRAVEQEARDGVEALAGLSLKQVVDQVDRQAAIVQRVVYRLLQQVGQNEVPALRDRLEQEFVELLVEPEDPAVHALPRVVVLVVGACERGRIQACEQYRDRQGQRFAPR